MKTSNAFWVCSLSFVAFFLASSARAAVECDIREGSGHCGGRVVYSKRFGDSGDVNKQQDRNLAACISLKPICNLSGFDAWVSTRADDSTNPGGELATQTTVVDEDGNFAYTSEKPYTVCRTTRRTKILGGNENPRAETSVYCPKVKTATAETCKDGTTLNVATGLCEIKDPSCGSGGGGEVIPIIKTGGGFVVTQNDHLGLIPKVDPKQYAATTPNTSQVPGLIGPTGDVKLGANLESGSSGVSAGGKYDSGSKSGIGQNGSSGSSIAGGSGSTGTGSSSGKGAGSGASAQDASMLASAYLGTGEGYANGSGSGAGAGHGGAGGGANSGGLSWFGANSATSGGASGELGFGKDGKDGKGGNGKDGKGGDASRGLASVSDDGRLQVEDPADYFLRSDIDVSLFKRVTAQCRKKEKMLVLAP